MTTFIERLAEMDETIASGNIRYWVNDDSAYKVTGQVTYLHDPAGTASLDGYVGLVDDEIGGMIAYGASDIMEALADKLNKLHIIETLLWEDA